MEILYLLELSGYFVCRQNLFFFFKPMSVSQIDFAVLSYRKARKGIFNSMNYILLCFNAFTAQSY